MQWENKTFSSLGAGGSFITFLIIEMKRGPNSLGIVEECSANIGKKDSNTFASLNLRILN